MRQIGIAFAFALQTGQRLDGQWRGTAEGLREKRCIQMQFIALRACTEKHRGTVALNSVHVHPRTPACTTFIGIYAGLHTDHN